MADDFLSLIQRELDQDDGEDEENGYENHDSVGNEFENDSSVGISNIYSHGNDGTLSNHVKTANDDINNNGNRNLIGSGSRNNGSKNTLGSRRQSSPDNRHFGDLLNYLIHQGQGEEDDSGFYQTRETEFATRIRDPELRGVTTGGSNIVNRDLNDSFGARIRPHTDRLSHAIPRKRYRRSATYPKLRQFTAAGGISHSQRVGNMSTINSFKQSNSYKQTSSKSGHANAGGNLNLANLNAAGNLNTANLNAGKAPYQRLYDSERFRNFREKVKREFEENSSSGDTIRRADPRVQHILGKITKSNRTLSGHDNRTNRTANSGHEHRNCTGNSGRKETESSRRVSARFSKQPSSNRASNRQGSTKKVSTKQPSDRPSNRSCNRASRRISRRRSSKGENLELNERGYDTGRFEHLLSVNTAIVKTPLKTPCYDGVTVCRKLTDRNLAKFDATHGSIPIIKSVRINTSGTKRPRANINPLALRFGRDVLSSTSKSQVQESTEEAPNMGNAERNRRHQEERNQRRGRHEMGIDDLLQSAEDILEAGGLIEPGGLTRKSKNTAKGTMSTKKLSGRKVFSSSSKKEFTSSSKTLNRRSKRIGINHNTAGDSQCRLTTGFNRWLGHSIRIRNRCRKLNDGTSLPLKALSPRRPTNASPLKKSQNSKRRSNLSWDDEDFALSVKNAIYQIETEKAFIETVQDEIEHLQGLTSSSSSDDANFIYRIDRQFDDDDLYRFDDGEFHDRNGAIHRLSDDRLRCINNEQSQECDGDHRYGDLDGDRSFNGLYKDSLDELQNEGRAGSSSPKPSNTKRLDDSSSGSTFLIEGKFSGIISCKQPRKRIDSKEVLGSSGTSGRFPNVVKTSKRSSPSKIMPKDGRTKDSRDQQQESKSSSFTLPLTTHTLHLLSASDENYSLLAKKRLKRYYAQQNYANPTHNDKGWETLNTEITKNLLATDDSKNRNEASLGHDRNMTGSHERVGGSYVRPAYDLGASSERPKDRDDRLDDRLADRHADRLADREDHINADSNFSPNLRGTEECYSRAKNNSIPNTFTDTFDNLHIDFDSNDDNDNLGNLMTQTNVLSQMRITNNDFKRKIMEEMDGRLDAESSDAEYRRLDYDSEHNGRLVRDSDEDSNRDTNRRRFLNGDSNNDFNLDPPGDPDDDSRDLDGFADAVYNKLYGEKDEVDFFANQILLDWSKEGADEDGNPMGNGTLNREKSISNGGNSNTGTLIDSGNIQRQMSHESEDEMTINDNGDDIHRNSSRRTLDGSQSLKKQLSSGPERTLSNRDEKVSSVMSGHQKTSSSGHVKTSLNEYGKTSSRKNRLVGSRLVGSRGSSRLLPCDSVNCLKEETFNKDKLVRSFTSMGSKRSGMILKVASHEILRGRNQLSAIESLGKLHNERASDGLLSKHESDITLRLEKCITELKRRTEGGRRSDDSFTERNERDVLVDITDGNSDQENKLLNFKEERWVTRNHRTLLECGMDKTLPGLKLLKRAEILQITKFTKTMSNMFGISVKDQGVTAKVDAKSAVCENPKATLRAEDVAIEKLRHPKATLRAEGTAGETAQAGQEKQESTKTDVKPLSISLSAGIPSLIHDAKKGDSSSAKKKEVESPFPKETEPQLEKEVDSQLPSPMAAPLRFVESSNTLTTQVKGEEDLPSSFPETLVLDSRTSIVKTKDGDTMKNEETNKADPDATVSNLLDKFEPLKRSLPHTTKKQLSKLTGSDYSSFLNLVQWTRRSAPSNADNRTKRRVEERDRIADFTKLIQMELSNFFIPNHLHYDPVLMRPRWGPLRKANLISTREVGWRAAKLDRMERRLANRIRAKSCSKSKSNSKAIISRGCKKTSKVGGKSGGMPKSSGLVGRIRGGKGLLRMRRRKKTRMDKDIFPTETNDFATWDFQRTSTFLNTMYGLQLFLPPLARMRGRKYQSARCLLRLEKKFEKTQKDVAEAETKLLNAVLKDSEPPPISKKRKASRQKSVKKNNTENTQETVVESLVANKKATRHESDDERTLSFLGDAKSRENSQNKAEREPKSRENSQKRSGSRRGKLREGSIGCRRRSRSRSRHNFQDPSCISRKKLIATSAAEARSTTERKPEAKPPNDGIWRLEGEKKKSKPQIFKFKTSASADTSGADMWEAQIRYVPYEEKGCGKNAHQLMAHGKGAHSRKDPYSSGHYPEQSWWNPKGDSESSTYGRNGQNFKGKNGSSKSTSKGYDFNGKGKTGISMGKDWYGNPQSIETWFGSTSGAPPSYNGWNQNDWFVSSTEWLDGGGGWNPQLHDDWNPDDWGTSYNPWGASGHWNDWSTPQYAGVVNSPAVSSAVSWPEGWVPISGEGLYDTVYQPESGEKNVGEDGDPFNGNGDNLIENASNNSEDKDSQSEDKESSECSHSSHGDSTSSGGGTNMSSGSSAAPTGSSPSIGSVGNSVPSKRNTSRKNTGGCSSRKSGGNSTTSGTNNAPTSTGKGTVSKRNARHVHRAPVLPSITENFGEDLLMTSDKNLDVYEAMPEPRKYCPSDDDEEEPNDEIFEQKVEGGEGSTADENEGPTVGGESSEGPTVGGESSADSGEGSVQELDDSPQLDALEEGQPIDDGSPEEPIDKLLTEESQSENITISEEVSSEGSKSSKAPIASEPSCNEEEITVGQNRFENCFENRIENCLEDDTDINPPPPPPEENFLPEENTLLMMGEELKKRREKLKEKRRLDEQINLAKREQLEGKHPMHISKNPLIDGSRYSERKLVLAPVKEKQKTSLAETGSLFPHLTIAELIRFSSLMWILVQEMNRKDPHWADKYESTNWVWRLSDINWLMRNEMEKKTGFYSWRATYNPLNFIRGEFNNKLKKKSSKKMAITKSNQFEPTYGSTSHAVFSALRYCRAKIWEFFCWMEHAQFEYRHISEHTRTVPIPRNPRNLPRPDHIPVGDRNHTRQFWKRQALFDFIQERFPGVSGRHGSGRNGRHGIPIYFDMDGVLRDVECNKIKRKQGKQSIRKKIFTLTQSGRHETHWVEFSTRENQILQEGDTKGDGYLSDIALFTEIPLDIVKCCVGGILVSHNGMPVYVHPEWYRWLGQDISQQVANEMDQDSSEEGVAHAIANQPSNQQKKDSHHGWYSRTNSNSTLNKTPLSEENMLQAVSQTILQGFNGQDGDAFDENLKSVGQARNEGSPLRRNGTSKKTLDGMFLDSEVITTPLVQHAAPGQPQPKMIGSSFLSGKRSFTDLLNEYAKRGSANNLHALLVPSPSRSPSPGQHISKLESNTTEKSAGNSEGLKLGAKQNSSLSFDQLPASDSSRKPRDSDPKIIKETRSSNRGIPVKVDTNIGADDAGGRAVGDAPLRIRGLEIKKILAWAADEASKKEFLARKTLSYYKAREYNYNAAESADFFETLRDLAVVQVQEEYLRTNAGEIRIGEHADGISMVPNGGGWVNPNLGNLNFDINGNDFSCTKRKSFLSYNIDRFRSSSTSKDDRNVEADCDGEGGVGQHGRILNQNEEPSQNQQPSLTDTDDIGMLIQKYLAEAEAAEIAASRMATPMPPSAQPHQSSSNETVEGLYAIENLNQGTPFASYVMAGDENLVEGALDPQAPEAVGRRRKSFFEQVKQNLDAFSLEFLQEEIFHGAYDDDDLRDILLEAKRILMDHFPEYRDDGDWNQGQLQGEGNDISKVTSGRHLQDMPANGGDRGDPVIDRSELASARITPSRMPPGIEYDNHIAGGGRANAGSSPNNKNAAVGTFGIPYNHLYGANGFGNNIANTFPHCRNGLGAGFGSFGSGIDITASPFKHGCYHSPFAETPLGLAAPPGLAGFGGSDNSAPGLKPNKSVIDEVFCQFEEIDTPPPPPSFPPPPEDDKENQDANYQAKETLLPRADSFCSNGENEMCKLESFKRSDSETCKPSGGEPMPPKQSTEKVSDLYRLDCGKNRVDDMGLLSSIEPSPTTVINPGTIWVVNQAGLSTSDEDSVRSDKKSKEAYGDLSSYGASKDSYGHALSQHAAGTLRQSLVVPPTSTTLNEHPQDDVTGAVGKHTGKMMYGPPVSGKFSWKNGNIGAQIGSRPDSLNNIDINQKNVKIDIIRRKLTAIECIEKRNDFHMKILRKAFDKLENSMLSYQKFDISQQKFDLSQPKDAKEKHVGRRNWLERQALVRGWKSWGKGQGKKRNGAKAQKNVGGNKKNVEKDKIVKNATEQKSDSKKSTPSTPTKTKGFSIDLHGIVSKDKAEKRRFRRAETTSRFGIVSKYKAKNNDVETEDVEGDTKNAVDEDKNDDTKAEQKTPRSDKKPDKTDKSEKKTESQPKVAVNPKMRWADAIDSDEEQICSGNESNFQSDFQSKIQPLAVSSSGASISSPTPSCVKPSLTEEVEKHSFVYGGHVEAVKATMSSKSTPKAKPLLANVFIKTRKSPKKSGIAKREKKSAETDAKSEEQKEHSTDEKSEFRSRLVKGKGKKGSQPKEQTEQRRRRMDREECQTDERPKQRIHREGQHLHAEPAKTKRHAREHEVHAQHIFGEWAARTLSAKTWIYDQKTMLGKKLERLRRA